MYSLLYLRPVSPGGWRSAATFFFAQHPDPAGDHFPLDVFQVLHFDLEDLLLPLEHLHILVLVRLCRVQLGDLRPAFPWSHRAERGPQHLLFELVVVGPGDSQLPRCIRHLYLAHKDLHDDLHPFPVGVLLPLSPCSHGLLVLLTF